MKWETERSPHDLTHLTFTSGKIGRLHALAMIPTLPGDGAEIDLVGAVRLSPLRRGLVVDSVMDICTFYIPHRHIYGEDWVDFIEGGYDENVTLATETWSDIDVACVPISSAPGGTFPLWVPEGYRQIWNRYYRPPTTVAENNDPFTNWTANDRRYGLECAWLKRIWSTGVADSLDAADYEVDTTGDVLSLFDFDQKAGELRTEQERQFMNIRYADIIKNAGGWTTFDADTRPKMLLRSTFWASGYDVDGTSEVSLGQHSGRVVQPFRHRVPRWNVPEHGTIWVMALLRFPPTSEDEQHFLVNKPQPTYADIAGDPDIVRSRPPYALDRNEIFRGSSSEALGLIPHSNWYRMHPDNVSRQYNVLNGYPFLSQVPSGVERWIVNSEDYEDVFQTDQLGHYNIAAKCNATWMRRLPSARESLLFDA
jgi:hypothetical protein